MGPRVALVVLILLVGAGCGAGAGADNDGAAQDDDAAADAENDDRAAGPASDREGTRTGTTAASDRQLLLLGDSLTVGARLTGRLEATLRAAGWDPEIVAEDGRSIEWAVAEVEDRSSVPSTVVVALGTNSAESVETFATDVAALVAALSDKGATTIVWLPPHDEEDDRYLERADALRDRAGGPLVVANWPAVLDAHPEWFGRDGIHYVEAGYLGMARFIRDQLALLAPPTTTVR